jgi:resuscitation-promoting factor RpfB
MDGKRTERGRHRRARTDHPSTVVSPQWSGDGSPDRPQWTPPEEPRSWFDRQPSRTSPAPDPAEGVPGTGEPWAAGDDARWRPVSDLTDTAWGLDGAWRDPSAQWNVAAPAGLVDRAGWDRDTAWGAGGATAGRDAETGRPDDSWTARGGAAGSSWAGRGGAAAAGRGGEAGTAWRGDTGSSWGGDSWAGLGGDAATGPGGEAGTAWRGDTGGGWGGNTWAGRGGETPTGWGGETATGWGGETATGWGGETGGGWGGDGWAGRGGDVGTWGGGLESAGSGVALLERVEEPEYPAEEQGEQRRHVVRHPLRIVLFAVVLFGLVAGSVAWLSMDKSVTLTVDGESRAVKTYASTVGGVLDDEHLSVGQHDTLAPKRDARISDGAEIILRRGRLVMLTVDGKTRQVWTTAPTVQEVLEQIGYRQDGLWMSESRSTRLPLNGFQLTLRTPKAVTVVVDGTKRTITTTAATVGAALDQAGLDIDADDKVSQLSTAPVRAGMIITITRVTTKTTTTQAVLQFETVEKTDPDADPGSRTVQTKGVTGLQQVTTVQTYVNGKLTSSKVIKRVLVRKPVDEVVVVGPEPEESTPPPSQPAECAEFPTTGGLNWCGLAQCESGLNPNAYNPAGPYYGLYQFDVGTWQANGGTGTPSGKSIAEQTRVAYNLYLARGRAPWPVCGRNL